MPTYVPIENAIEDIITLANCWLTLLPTYDCNTTKIRVQEVINEVFDSAEPIPLEPADYQALMHEASLLLRDWLKFEHQAKPLIGPGLNRATSVMVSVASLKNPRKPLKFNTPWCTHKRGGPLKGAIFKIPAGHLMARCMNLETSPIDPAAASRGEVIVDEHGKVTAFRYNVDLTRMIVSGRKKFEDALVDYIQATLGLKEEA